LVEIRPLPIGGEAAEREGTTLVDICGLQSKIFPLRSRLLDEKDMCMRLDYCNLVYRLYY
jgi:hypothetical protein